jgi:hypothetical protein
MHGVPESNSSELRQREGCNTLGIATIEPNKYGTVFQTSFLYIKIKKVIIDCIIFTRVTSKLQATGINYLGGFEDERASII